MFFLCLGIWGSFYAILLNRVLKEEKQINTEQDNEQKLLGKKRFSYFYSFPVISSADFLSKLEDFVAHVTTQTKKVD